MYICLSCVLSVFVYAVEGKLNLRLKHMCIHDSIMCVVFPLVQVNIKMCVWESFL